MKTTSIHLDRFEENAHFCRLTTNSQQLADNLAQQFRYRPDGYEYMEKYREGHWDGYISFFKSKKLCFDDVILYCGNFPIGLVPRLSAMEFGGQDVVVENNATSKPSAGEYVENKAFLCSLELRGNRGQILEARDYQRESCLRLYHHRRGIVVSPTGSGKSLIIYLLMRLFLRRHTQERILIVVPSISLVDQLFTDFANYSQVDMDFNAHAMVARIHNQSNENIENTGKQIVIATWQTVYKHRKLTGTFGCVVGDEAHKFKAKSLTEIMTNAVSAEYRFGLTGTLPTKTAVILHYESVFGPDIQAPTTQQLIERKILANISINAICLHHRPSAVELEDLNSSKTGTAGRTKYYVKEIEWLNACRKRNQFIVNLVFSDMMIGNILVLFRYVGKHGKVIHAMMQERAEHDRLEKQIYYISGETKSEQRQQVRSIAENSSNAVIVASLGTFSTGIDIQELHNVVFAAPSKSQIVILQSIGRALRKSATADTTIYDIGDVIIGKNKQYASDHFHKRCKLYKEQKLPFRVFNIDLVRNSK